MTIALFAVKGCTSEREKYLNPPSSFWFFHCFGNRVVCFLTEEFQWRYQLSLEHDVLFGNVLPSASRLPIRFTKWQPKVINRRIWGEITWGKTGKRHLLPFQYENMMANILKNNLKRELGNSLTRSFGVRYIWSDWGNSSFLLALLPVYLLCCLLCHLFLFRRNIRQHWPISW